MGLAKTARESPMNAGESALDLAARRLERALVQLEQRLAEGAGPPAAATGGDLFADDDRAALAAELERARVREKELEAAGAEASEALGRAILEIKAALNGQAVAPADADQEH
jgi:hypothetical protein